MHTKIRSDALKEWEKSDYALSWNGDNSGGKGGYALLLIILNEDCSARPTRLTHSKDEWPYDQLATHIFKMGSSSETPISAPVVKNGCFENALSIAFKLMGHYAPDDNLRDKFCIQILASMMKKMSIDFLPWHRDARGRSSPRIVQYDWWMMINRHNHQSIVVDLTLEDAMESAATAMADSNPTAPWSIPKVLSEMGSLWKKTVLPEDWNVTEASLSHTRTKVGHEYVWKTYEYVEQHYDGRVWKHHMALVWAILFSRVTPYLFFDKPDRFDQYRDPHEITRRIRKFPWIAGTSRYHRGVTAPKPYITMMSTAIIAIRDHNSPLALRAAANSNSFGTAWTDKHGKICVSLTICLHLI